MKRSLIAVLCLLGMTSVFGQTLERVLIPVAVGGIPGSYGSLWVSKLAVDNGSDVARILEMPLVCQALCPPSIAAPQHANEEVPFQAQPGASPGLIAFTDGSPEEILFNLRVQDFSRQAQTWGTQIPVVWERNLFTSARRLLNVPLGDSFRTTLRIYDINGNGGRFRVRAFRLFLNAETYAEAVLTLEAPPAPRPTMHQYKPSFAQIADVATYLQINTVEPMVGLEITPLTEDAHYYVFASVTNNETQHVTTIVPN